MHIPPIGLFSLLLASLGAVASARPNAITTVADTAAAIDTADTISPITTGPAAVNVAATRTIVWSTTQTSVTYPLWIDATAVTMITTQTITTLIPNAPSRTTDPVVGDGTGGDGSVGVVETVIGRTTYEYRLGYSDGHSSTSWSSATHSYLATVAV